MPSPPSCLESPCPNWHCNLIAALTKPRNMRERIFRTLRGLINPTADPWGSPRRGCSPPLLIVMIVDRMRRCIVSILRMFFPTSSANSKDEDSHPTARSWPCFSQGVKSVNQSQCCQYTARFYCLPLSIFVIMHASTHACTHA